MLTLIFLFICFYNIPNIGNRYSNILAIILCILLIVLFIIHKVGQMYDKSLRYFFKGIIKKYYAITIIQVIALIVMANQFVYNNWTEINDRAISGYDIEDATAYDFIVYNSIFVPKPIKQMFIIFDGIETLSGASTEEDLLNMYDDIKDEYNLTLEECYNGFHKLFLCLMIITIGNILKVFLDSLKSIIHDIKLIRGRKRKAGT